MLRTFTETPDIENGYLLEPSKGWFGVIKPTEKINYFPNPNFVNIATNGPTMIGGYSQSSEGVFKPSSILSSVNPSGVWGWNFGIVDGLYTLSAYVKTNDDSKRTIHVVFGDDYVDYEATSTWKRVSITSQLLNDGLDKNALLVCEGGDFLITAVQVEAGNLTTFFSGDTPATRYDEDDAYQWTGQRYQSYSVRSDTAYSGGELISLYELGFKVTEFTGLGYTDLAPITFEQASSDVRLYDCSTTEPRDIEITGIVIGNGFDDYQGILGNIGELLYNATRPSRIVFTPYDFCDDEVSCLYFDFVYQTGLNETIDSVVGQEITIEGTTLDPCLYSCVDYYYDTMLLSDLIVSEAEDALFFVRKDGTAESITFPNLVGGTVYSTTLIDADDMNGILYAIIQQIPSTGITDTVTYFVKYDGLVWTELASVEIATGLAGPPTNIGTSRGTFNSVTCVPIGPAPGVYVTGYYLPADLGYGTGVTQDSATFPQSLFRYKPETNSIDGYAINNSNFVDTIGKTTCVAYSEKWGTLFVGGMFDGYRTPDGTLYAADQHFYLSNEATPSYEQLPLSSPFIIASSGGNPVTDPGISSRFSVGTGVFNIYTSGDDVFLLGNVTNSSLYLTLDPAARFAIIRFDYISNLHYFREIDMTYPYNHNANPYVESGYVMDMLHWGRYYNFFITGSFSHVTNIGWDAYANVVNDVAILNMRGYNANYDIADKGEIAALTEKNISTIDPDYRIGVYDSAVNDDNTTATVVAGDTYVRPIDLGDRVLFYGRMSAYGRNDDRIASCGFVEYIPLSTTDLSAGNFVTSLLAISTTGLATDTACWSVVSKIKSLYGYDLIVSSAKSTGLGSVFFYNSGVEVNICSSSGTTDVEIVIDTDDGVIGLTGFRNMTTGKQIYFTPVDLPADKVYTFYYKDYTVAFKRDDELAEYFVSGQFVNNGNPFTVSDGDILVPVFSMEETYEETATNDPSFTVKYKPCYASYGELVRCTTSS
jgi:hypothetical protein